MTDGHEGSQGSFTSKNSQRCSATSNAENQAWGGALDALEVAVGSKATIDADALHYCKPLQKANILTEYLILHYICKDMVTVGSRPTILTKGVQRNVFLPGAVTFFARGEWKIFLPPYLFSHFTWGGKEITWVGKDIMIDQVNILRASCQLKGLPLEK